MTAGLTGALDRGAGGLQSEQRTCLQPSPGLFGVAGEGDLAGSHSDSILVLMALPFCAHNAFIRVVEHEGSKCIQHAAADPTCSVLLFDSTLRALHCSSWLCWLQQATLVT